VTETRSTVVVVDDAAEVRALVRTQLSLSGRYVVVGEGSDGTEAIELAARHQPEVVLLDVSMPKMDGLEALPRIKQLAPQSRVVLYTGFEEGGLAVRAHELGAAGLIEKSGAIGELADQLDAIKRTTPVGSSGTSATQDATSRRDELTVLDEHLERFREVFEDAAIGMATMTLTGHIVRANSALAASVGWDAHDLVGTPYSALATGGDPDAVAQALRDAQDGRTAAVQFELEVGTPTQRRWLLATAAPVRDARGRPLYLFLQSQDISVQRRTEEALRQSEERFRLLVEAVQDYAIFMLDPSGLVVSWNAGAQRIKGYEAHEIIGQHFRRFYSDEMQSIKHPEHELELALRDGHYEEEGWRIRKDGSRFWATVVITAVHNALGEHVGFAKVTRNIDERRRMLLDAEAAAQALATANHELEAANALLEREAADQAQFLAVTAHELRTPVSVLSGSATLLARHWAQMTEADRTELSQSMNTSADRLLRLLSDLLTASRLESNAIHLDMQAIDVSQLLTRTVAAARAATPDADIRLAGVSDLQVLGEPDRLAQAIDNLLGNALRHGVPPVVVRADRRGDRVDITVSDGGEGVAVGLQERLFERFATGTHRGGTGLGLFIVRELARAHGGDAWYAPDADGHSTFVLSLPAHHRPDPAPARGGADLP
jgi:PAS domain S-box-containing protein